MVAQTAANRGEKVVALLQGRDKIGECFDSHAGHVGKFSDVCGICRCIFYSHSLVGTPRRKHLHLETRLSGADMMFKAIDRIVGGADRLHTVMLHQAAGRPVGLLKAFGAIVVDFAGRGRRKELVDPEDGAKFQVCPVIQRIAHRVWHRLGPLLEFLPVGSVFTCNIPLVDSVGAHGTPFIMVALKPYAAQVFKYVVVGHILRIKVAMIVDNRLWCRIFMIETLSRGGLQQEVFIIKLLHGKIKLELITDCFTKLSRILQQSQPKREKSVTFDTIISVSRSR